MVGRNPHLPRSFRMPRPFIDETGHVYGRLTVLGKSPEQPTAHAYWLCRCECGNLKSLAGGHLRRGNIRSCGCLNMEKLRGRKRHGKTVGGRRQRIFRIWLGMRDRCSNPKLPHYSRYGGRGITVCDEWQHSFEAFYRDMGDPPSPDHSIDRIDNDRGYEPSNCRWATRSEQNRNQRPRAPKASSG